MKGFLISVGIVAALYFADQQFADGKYTAAVGRMATQIRHSFGVWAATVALLGGLIDVDRTISDIPEV